MTKEQLSPTAERLLMMLAMLLQSALPLAKYVAQNAQPKTRAAFRALVGTRQLDELIKSLQQLRR